MFASHDVVLYTDGSFKRPRKAAYGWVTATAGVRPQARAVSVEVEDDSSYSTLMESAAIVDALWEFSRSGRKLVVRADCQALSLELQRHGLGRLTSLPKLIRFEDALKLASIWPLMEVEFQWVKGHANEFHNIVVDQMLRMLTSEGSSEAEAVAFARTACDAHECVAWGKIRTVEGYVNGYSLVKEFAA